MSISAWIKPRLHEQFLCDKFYLFASERSGRLHEHFLFENKRLKIENYI